MTDRRAIGFIGGSGVYVVDGLENAASETVETPWGAPSGPIISGRIAGTEVRFIARHGPGHIVPPSAVNYRANIDALKRAGVTDLVSISACGSLREDLAPGAFVFIDQMIDRAVGRETSFFGVGCVAHVSLADPICPALSATLAEACEGVGAPVRRGGTYVTIEGPQFSSRAESKLYRAWGADVIGMTGSTEAKLAREAELPYATIAMVTDYDCWRVESGPVDVAAILEVMHANTALVQRAVPAIAQRLGPTRAPSPLQIETCLDTAIITPPGARDPALVAKLDAVAGRAFAAESAHNDAD